MEANHRLINAVNTMLDELEFQATNSQTAHHFTYTVQEKSGIGTILSPDEQIKMLFMLYNKGVIAGFGKNVYDHSEEGSYFIELEDKSFKRERKLVNAIGFFDERRISQTGQKQNIAEATHTISINLDGGTLFASVDDNRSYPIAQFTDGSKMRKIFNKLFSDKPGVPYRNIDLNMSTSTNIRQIFASNRYEYLLIFMDENLLPRTIKLKSREIELTQSELSQFLSQIKAKYRNSFIPILSQL